MGRLPAPLSEGEGASRGGEDPAEGKSSGWVGLGLGDSRLEGVGPGKGPGKGPAVCSADPGERVQSARTP